MFSAEFVLKQAHERVFGANYCEIRCSSSQKVAGAPFLVAKVLTKLISLEVRAYLFVWFLLGRITQLVT